MQLTLRDRLSFPAGVAPGFDSSHPVSKNVQFSGVTLGSNIVDLMTGKPGVFSLGTPTPTADAMGPALKFPLAGSPTVSFAGKPLYAGHDFVLAAIVMFDTVSGTQFILSTSNNAGSGASLRILNSGAFRFSFGMNGAAAFNSTIIPNPVANVPYFFAASVRQNNSSQFDICMVVTNLLTGAICSDSLANQNTASATDTGTCEVGARVGGSQALGRIYASMYSTAAASIPTLLQWAADPWSFWYPRFEPEFAIGSALAAMTPYNPWPQAAPILAM